MAPSIIGGGCFCCGGQPRITRGFLPGWIRWRVVDPSSALVKVPLFAGLPRDRASELLASCRTRVYKANETVVSEGDEGFSMFVVLSGQVEVSRLNDSGDRVPFHRLGPGDYFGEMSLVGSLPRSADVITVAPCEFLVIDRPAFIGSVLRVPELCLRVLNHLCRRIRQADDARLSKLSVRQRLVRALMELAIPVPSEKYGPRALSVEISRQQLGDRILARRETVSRELSRLVAEHLVKVRGKLILIPNPEQFTDLVSRS